MCQNNALCKQRKPVAEKSDEEWIRMGSPTRRSQSPKRRNISPTPVKVEPTKKNIPGSVVALKTPREHSSTSRVHVPGSASSAMDQDDQSGASSATWEDLGEHQKEEKALAYLQQKIGVDRARLERNLSNVIEHLKR